LKGIESPKELWYWPKPEKVKKLVDDDEQEEDAKPPKCAKIVEEDEEFEEDLFPEVCEKYNSMVQKSRRYSLQSHCLPSLDECTTGNFD
jgi:hypothetical protein